MYGDLLQELGLSPNEIKIYEALLTYGGSGVSTISLRSKIHRRNVYDTINRLLEKGLVYEVHGQGEVVYEPVEPTKLLEMAQEKARKVEMSLPAMMKTFHAKKAKERSYIYKGIEGIKNYMRDTLEVGEDIYILGFKGGWSDPRLAGYTNSYLAEIKRRKMKIWALVDHEVSEKTPNVPAQMTTHYKYLPKGYKSHSALDIFGDYVISYSGIELGKWAEDVTTFVTVSPNLADAYRTWWKMIWDMLPEPKKRK